MNTSELLHPSKLFTYICSSDLNLAEHYIGFRRWALLVSRLWSYVDVDATLMLPCRSLFVAYNIARPTSGGGYE